VAATACEGDHDADVVRHQFGRTHTQGVQDAHHVRRLILLVIAAIRLRREAQPTQVERDNHVVFDECARQMTPHVARCAEALQHDDRWTMTADPHMDGCTVGFDRPRLHHGREGINPIYVGIPAHRRVILNFQVCPLLIIRFHF
jgi:hypothetical protein